MTIFVFLLALLVQAAPAPLRVWQMEPDNETQLKLDWTGYGNDGYPPILGRVRPDDVLFEFTAGGLIGGEGHTAVRHFKIEKGSALQADPIAVRPHDFVIEWLAAGWSESRTRSESATLETLHAQLCRDDAAGDFLDSTLRCTAGDGLWQVATHLYERPKRYYRVRWSDPFAFTMVDIRDTPYPDCTVTDIRGEEYPNLLGN